MYGNSNIKESPSSKKYIPQSTISISPSSHVSWVAYSMQWTGHAYSLHFLCSYDATVLYNGGRKFNIAWVNFLCAPSWMCRCDFAASIVNNVPRVVTYPAMHLKGHPYPLFRRFINPSNEFSSTSTLSCEVFSVALIEQLDVLFTYPTSGLSILACT